MLVVDFGAQYAQLIARRVREARVFSEVIPHTASVDEIKARDPQAVVLSGGPASVYADGAPQLDPALFDLGVPVFGICYGFQAMAQALGGSVARTGTSEYGRTELEVVGGDLHSDLPGTQPVWMSHGDAVTAAPDGFEVVATSPGSPVAAFENRARNLAGVQYHPEVLHSPHGQQVLTRFLHDFAGIAADWTPAGIAGALIEQVRNQVGDGHAICGLSGGVDSAVAAALVQRAIGDRLTCVFVDHGLLRAGERAQVQRDFVAATGANLVTVDAEATFLDALSGVTNPEGKRKIIGRQFIRAFEGAVRDTLENKDIEFLVQGTLYPDVVESGGGTGAANIKSHHNVGGLPGDLKFKLVEPLRLLFKDEVRAVGRELGLPEEIVARQPFPGPGLAIRIVGEVTAARLDNAAACRLDRARGADRSRFGSADLAVPGGTAGRCPIGRRAGRRPDLRASDRVATGVERGRHDRRLDSGALRGVGADFHPDHERGHRGQPRGAGRHQQTARHHRVGVARPTMRAAKRRASSREAARGRVGQLGLAGAVSEPPIHLR